MSSSIRQLRNIVIRHFVFHVQRIYCELTFRLPWDTCMVRMALSCQSFSVFPCTTLHLFHVFPSLSFLFILVLFSLFSSWHFVCLELFFLPELSSLPFHFLVSFSCSLLCIYTFMVDYSLVRLDYPPVSFFFTHLCGLLKAIGRERPRVRLFVGNDYPHRFVLLFLFPLVHHSVGISQSLTMSVEEVRTSEFETGLSSSDDRGALKVSSLSTPHKAWRICFSPKEKDEKRIRNRFQFPSSVKVRIPNDDDRACHSYADEVCFYEANFISGLHFLVHPFFRELFFRLLLAPAQLVPNL